MNTNRTCGCKGCRTCLICEKILGVPRKDFYSIYKDLPSYVYCYKCKKLCPGWNVQTVLDNHENHSEVSGIDLPGIVVEPDFLNKDEGKEVMTELEKIPWEISQSGRRKQNFGPKTNFKKMKIQKGDFAGFPKSVEFIHERLREHTLLKEYQSIEQCTLEYDPETGASIDPHIDDCWVWGERVVTVNCLGDSVLTLVKYKGDNKKYNLNLVDSYKDKLMVELLEENYLEQFEDVVVRIPMPSYSLIVLYGPARYQFEHLVLREDVLERRVCLAFREFTPMDMEGGKDFSIGSDITKIARNFF